MIPANKGKTYKAEPLSEAEVQALLRQCSRRYPTGVRNRALITILYRAGLRVSEALDLKPADVDTGRGTVRVLHGKGDKARVVGLDDGALAVIEAWLEVRRRRGIRGGRLFCTLEGGPVSGSYVRAMLRRVAGRAGLEKRVHPHGLRHTFAAELLEEGVDVVTIQKALGHRWLNTTQVYLEHISPAAVVAAGRARQWEAGA
jgi:site-specific recombinase XerD